MEQFLMTRPDQERFELFARHFEAFDADLDVFGNSHQFQLERNILRQPCRLLRRNGNPNYLIDISLAGHWREMPFEEDLPHDVAVFAYYEPPESQFIWKKSADIVRGQPFHILRHVLDQHLARGLKLINEWQANVILETRVRVENLKKK